MAYSAPTIDTTGLVLPTYEDIRNALLADFLAAYPATTYTGVDSADYQWISAVSLKIYDSNLLAQMVYNARSPATAIGADLDALVKLNGIARKQASYSTVPLQVTGAAGTVLTGCQAQDSNGNLWDLPATVTIPNGGSIVVTATADSAGAIQAAPGTVTTKVNITAGWVAVTNPSAASPGQPVETDSQLRARQAISVSLPSSTMVQKTSAAIAGVPGVTRYNVLENQTGEVDAYGNPPHSLSCVVEGGTDLNVATAIYGNRGIGAYMNGTTEVDITDATNGGYTTPIRFSRPAYVAAAVSLNVHALNIGFTTAVQNAITAALLLYLNSLQIGETLTCSALYAVAMTATPNILEPVFSIQTLTIGATAQTQGTADLSLPYNQVISGVAGNISLQVV